MTIKETAKMAQMERMLVELTYMPIEKLLKYDEVHEEYIDETTRACSNLEESFKMDYKAYDPALVDEKLDALLIKSRFEVVDKMMKKLEQYR